MKPLEDRRRQRWAEDRGDVVRHVSLVAGPEENDIDPLFVARVAVGGIGDALRTAVGNHEPERIALGDRALTLVEGLPIVPALGAKGTF